MSTVARRAFLGLGSVALPLLAIAARAVTVSLGDGLAARNLSLTALRAVFDPASQAGQALLDTLIAYLRPRRLLLVLDNCEHVITASAALAARLLDSCPELRILATSQQALDHAGEIVWPVAPLR